MESVGSSNVESVVGNATGLLGRDSDGGTELGTLNHNTRGSVSTSSNDEVVAEGLIRMVRKEGGEIWRAGAG